MMGPPSWSTVGEDPERRGRTGLPALPGEALHGLHGLQAALTAAVEGLEHQRADAGLGERGDPLGDVGLRTDQRRRLDELDRNRGRGLVLLALEVEGLDRLRLGLVAVADGEVVVEVLPSGAHATDVE